LDAFDRGVERMMKIMILERLQCPHWRSMAAWLRDRNTSEQLMHLQRYVVEDDPLTAHWPCGLCDQERRAIQVLNYMNAMVVNGLVWPLPRGFDPRFLQQWEEVTVKKANRRER